MEAPVRPRRRRLQVSLLSLLLFVLLCGAAMGLFALKWENERLREESKGLHAQLENLNVYDSTMVWARYINSKEPWKWRVYFPSEQKCFLCVQTNDIGIRDFDAAKALAIPVTLGPGEFTIEARKNERNGQGAELTFVVDDRRLTFFVESILPKGGYHDGVLNDVAYSFDVGDRIELMREKESGLRMPDAKPSPGLLIWLEPIKK
jgi:hypothetical protein